MSQRKRGPADRPTPIEAVMVVEPRVLIRMTLSDYLRGCGYKVLEATGAREAIRILEGGIKVHAVFAATKLEEQMDGFALAQHVRANYSGVEVLLANSVSMAAKKAGDLCENGPGEKPYDHQLVAERLKLLLQREKTPKK